MLQKNPIIKYITRFIIPYIALYAAYIQLGGEASPGGGFQAGSIFASAVIVIELICNKTMCDKHMYKDLLIITSSIGVMIYTLVGFISFMYGDNYLNYYSLNQNYLAAQYCGIFTIELGVGLTVASVMCLIYSLISSNH